MKAHFNGGIMNGYQVDTDGSDELVFTRWKCGEYPSAGYQVTYKYYKKAVVNLGVPVAFYKYQPEAGEVRAVSMAEHNLLNQLSANALGARNYSGSLRNNAFGISFLQ